ncbi:MAG: spermidine synthase [Actinomycetota bacterium]
MLFLELALIRLVAAHIVYVRYFTNFVLLASFLGIGLGFLRATSKRDSFLSLPSFLLLAIAFVIIFPVGQRSGATHGLFGTPSLPVWLSLPLIFILVTLVMMASAAGVARVFVTLRPLHAYRLDIIGSILGIILFTIASILRLPPVAWVLAVALLFAATMGRRAAPRHWAALGSGIALLGGQWLISGDIWSPYYRVTVEERRADGRTPIFVNGIPHQSIWTLEDLVREQPFYTYPYRHIPENPLDEVLIIGAGSGNDVALALARGAGHVDAVEIDPVLQGLGRERHPHRPYQDTRVRDHVEDGRAFLERSDRRYDLILFALPDSLVLVAGQGSLRLESFLFTREAFEAVRSHLKPEGAFSMYNYYRPDVFARYAETLTEVFGSRPCLDVGEPGAGANSQAVLTISAQPDVLRCSTFWVPPRVVPRPATDNYPFPYAQGRGLSTFYIVSLAFLLLGSALAIRRFGHVKVADARPYLDLFFMGAAFLLLETKSIVQFALLFGTTWLVNALVFAGILLSVLLAIEIAERVTRLRPGLLYSALLVSLGVAWVVRPEQLLGLSPVTRFVAATTITFAPIFFGNLIFAERFRSVSSSTTAFGINLLGAILGGLLEYSSVVLGYRGLILVVAAVYTAAYVLRPAQIPSHMPNVLKSVGERVPTGPEGTGDP